MTGKESNRPHLVIGTAGHIDHGKTALVKALTGRDTDRLGEEKRRGITIELGFAFYGDHAAFVDVPGHEKFVKTMVAGASTMRAALLVIAADDGVMPQTREHLAVLDAMGIEQGVVAVTKADLVEPEWIELVVEEVGELIAETSLRNAPIVTVDSISGRGLNELKSHLDRMIENARVEYDPGFFRMPVDRSFLVKGHGRVVTGTVWSGSVRENTRLEMVPGRAGFRVRGLQAHEKPVYRVRTGDRAALNLAGDAEPERGDVLVEPGRVVETEFLDVRVSLLPDAREVRHRMRVRVHLGTAEVIGRLLTVGGEVIPPGTNGYARLDLERKIAAMFGDRGVIRLYSPMETLGGIQVIDPLPPGRRRSFRVRGMPLSPSRKGMQVSTTTVDRELEGDDDEILRAFIESRGVVGESDLLRMIPWDPARFRKAVAAVEDAVELIAVSSRDNRLVDRKLWRRWKDRSLEVTADFHRRRPEEEGMPKQAWADAVCGGKVDEAITGALLKTLEEEGIIRFAHGAVALFEHRVSLKPEDEKIAEEVYRVLRESGMNTPLPASLAAEFGTTVEKMKKILRAMKQVGRTVLLDERVVITGEALEEAKRRLQEAFSDGGEFSVGEVSELLGSTRKYVVPLLEHLDELGFTVRDDDKRKLAE